MRGHIPTSATPIIATPGPDCAEQSASDQATLGFTDARIDPETVAFGGPLQDRIQVLRSRCPGREGRTVGWM